MVTYYADTSAAVKLYVLELGSGWIRDLLAHGQQPVVLSSVLLRVESGQSEPSSVRVYV